MVKFNVLRFHSVFKQNLYKKKVSLIVSYLTQQIQSSNFNPTLVYTPHSIISLG